MSEQTKRIVAIVALVVGILSLAFAICLPICGIFLGAVGLILAIVALRSESKVLAIVALVINVLVLVLSIVVWIVSAAWLMGKVELPGVPRPVLERRAADAGASPAPDASATPRTAEPELLEWDDGHDEDEPSGQSPAEPRPTSR